MITNVLRQVSNKLFYGIVCLIIFLNLGCQNKKQQQVHGLVKKEATSLQKISFPKVILRLESESKNVSKLAELNFDFYGKDLSHQSFETQKTEIRNLILIHFANSDFKKIPEQNLRIKDPKLSAYLNQFLSKGKIEESEYKLVRVY